MTLIDSWQAGRLRVPWELLAKTNRSKLFKARRENADYWLIGGRRPKNNRQDNDKLIILELMPDGKGQIITDVPANRSGDFSERYDRYPIDMTALRHVLGYQDLHKQQDTQKQQNGSAQQTYNPDTHYVVQRIRPGAGRPRRVLTEQEQANIRRLRQDGMSINDISAELGINNRRVMAYCRELQEEQK